MIKNNLIRKVDGDNIIGICRKTAVSLQVVGQGQGLRLLRKRKGENCYLYVPPSFIIACMEFFYLSKSLL